ncbi:MAG TPA: VOC family protein, partial [Vicinamibacterales bacterium]|nr:VOC family protein [Vicinamibacterales bacterium]
MEFWVGNARQAAYFYRRGFGFSQAGYAGLETGSRDQTSYLMTQGKIRLVLTTPLAPDHPAADHVHRHGDGVRDIAFHVDDADRAFEEAVKRGAEVAMEPHDLQGDGGRVRRAAIKTYGDTIHSFISDNGYTGVFLPGYVERHVPGQDVGLLRIDHMVGNVGLGQMNQWADWYHRVLGFERFISFDDKDISTEYSALMSVVMADDAQAIKFPLNEPAPGKKKSQIDEYL